MSIAVWLLVVLPILIVVFSMVFSNLPIVQVDPAFTTAISTWSEYSNRVAVFIPVHTLYTVVGLAISLEIGIVILRSLLMILKITPKT
jgi:hypothetical protein